jgi:hypothetical protein
VSSEFLLGLAVAFGTVAVGLIILIIMEQEKRKSPIEESFEPKQIKTVNVLPQSVGKTVTNDVINEAKGKLKLLDLEKEILSYAVRRLYEASAEGKITEAERDQLALKYETDLARIKEEIERGESIVALNELEKMQEELVKMFSERFDEMNQKIENLKIKSGFATPTPKEMVPQEMVKEPIQMEQQSVEEEPQEEISEEEKTEDLKQPSEKTAETKVKKASKPKPPVEPETDDAEKKVEEIVAEVEKVLKKLGQMEVEE